MHEEIKSLISDSGLYILHCSFNSGFTQFKSHLFLECEWQHGIVLFANGICSGEEISMSI